MSHEQKTDSKENREYKKILRGAGSVLRLSESQEKEPDRSAVVCTRIYYGDARHGDGGHNGGHNHSANASWQRFLQAADRGSRRKVK